MASKILQSIAKDKLDNLFQAYNTSHKVFWDENKKKLLHPGEYGEFREKAARELISLFIPQTMKVDEGFIITSQGEVSSQCDLIVYDPNSCPNLVSAAHQKFFPIECVIAVGEIKSDISCASNMTKVLNKLAKTKKLKESIPNPVTYRSFDNRHFCPTHRELDQIFTFVLAKSIPDMPEGGFKYNQNILHRHQHNFIVGMKGGHACYKKDNVNSYCYPQTDFVEHEQVSCPEQNQTINVNFGILLTSIFEHCTSATLLELNPLLYLADDITSLDEEEFEDIKSEDCRS
ncbi:DUF6602 domain-containing protein [Vibrio sp. 1F263]|uniref:DUF6602 domain-containing protein n=1 Tax=Vibrio sp. 1F263 TaxID=3230012 RepID=UPI00352FA97F